MTLLDSTSTVDEQYGSNRETASVNKQQETTQKNIWMYIARVLCQDKYRSSFSAEMLNKALTDQGMNGSLALHLFRTKFSDWRCFAIFEVFVDGCMHR